PNPGVDTRFPSPGVDDQFPLPGVDARFVDGVDTRFEAGQTITIDTPGSLDVATFKIGTEHTITPGTASPGSGGVISYETRWLVDGSVAAATAAYTPQAPDEGQSISAQWRAVETGGSNDNESAWQTVGSGTVVPQAVLSALSVTGPQVNGDLPVSYTVSADTGSSWGFYAGSPVDAAALRAGTGAVDFGTASLTAAASTLNTNIANGIDASGLDLFLVLDGSNTVVQATGSVPFAIDTQSPTGTISGVQTGATTATISLNLTDEAGDIIDFAVYPTASTPSEADIEAGTGATWSVQDVTGTAGDTNDQSATGLTASTGYRAWAVITDAQGSKTTLTSTTFTTAAGSSVVTFTAANGTGLSTLSPEDGQAFVNTILSQPRPDPLIYANRVLSGGSQSAYLIQTGRNVVSDLSVVADIGVQGSTSSEAAGVSLADIVNNCRYVLRYNSLNNRWEVSRFGVDGSTTFYTGDNLGSAGVDDAGMTPGVSRSARLAISGIGTQLTASINGTNLVLNQDISADSWSSGQAGIVFTGQHNVSEEGLYIDNYEFGG
ncbi:MAG: hypothetical protein AAF993_22905, partial [Pseudomonadota bacterium]